MAIHHFYAIFFGILSFSLKNIGYVFQKKGVNLINARRRTRMASKGILDYLCTGKWLLGFILPFCGGVALMVAYSCGPISLVMPFTATGFVVLVLFLRFYIGEKIEWIEWISIGIILIGTTIINLFASHIRELYTTPQAMVLKIMSAPSLFFLILPNVVCLLYSYWSFLHNHRYGGTIYGITGGIVGGASLIFQKPYSTGLMLFFLGQAPQPVPVVVCGILFTGLSLLAVVFLNIAYKYGRGIHVAPLYTVFQILFPIIGGIVIFEEWHCLGITGIVIQSCGIVSILGAVGMLSLYNEKKVRKNS
jgi:uncharacterized membrane protein